MTSIAIIQYETEETLRTIIRFSVDGEADNRLGLKLRKSLKASGIILQRKTSTYEGDIAQATLSVCFQSFWNIVANHPGPGRLDNFWMYSDKSKPLACKETEMISKVRKRRKSSIKIDQ